MDVVDSDELHTQLVCKLYASCAREFYAEKKTNKDLRPHLILNKSVRKTKSNLNYIIPVLYNSRTQFCIVHCSPDSISIRMYCIKEWVFQIIISNFTC